MGNVQGTVIAKDFVAKDFCHLQVRVDENYSFKAGQFAMLTFSIHDKKVSRAYSFASPPSLLTKNKIIEFGIKKKKDGFVSVYVCDSLKVGEIIEISKPYGHMTLERAPTRDFVFIAVGSGITPFRSIILHLLEERSYDSIHLIYGCRNRESAAYHDFFSSIEDISYYPVLSREEAEGFYQGHVQDVLEEFPSLISTHYTYFICGLPQMVNDIKEILLKNGVESSHILFESF